VKIKRKISPIKVLIADDHTLFREGLKRLLETEKDIKVVGETSTGRQTLDRLLCPHARHGALPVASFPDIVLLDINLPDINGIKIAHTLKQKNENIKIIILSMYEDEAHILQAFNTGADGYAIKTMPPEEVIKAIKHVAAGETVIPRSLTPRLISGLRKVSGQEVKKGMFDITQREVEIIAYLAQGLSNKEIAFNLKTKTKTVKNQMNNILSKLNVANRTQAVLKAIKLGIISGE